MNILVFYMSLKSRSNDIINYETDLNNPSILTTQTKGEEPDSAEVIAVSGVQTNEAATKYLILHLIEQNRFLDKIVYVATDQVLSGEDSTSVYFRNKIGEFCKSFNRTPEMVIVPAKQRPMTEILNDIANQISVDDNVFIDTTGGMRDSVNLMQLLMKFLKYKGIRLEQAYYSVLIMKAGDKSGKITNCDDYFNQLDILDGINQFVTTGSSEQLAKYLNNCKNEYIHKLLVNMNNFADAMQICRLNNLDLYLDGMKTELNEIEKITPQTSEEFILKLMAPVIKNRFFKENGDINDYCSLILWCLDNNMLQQALTLYTEYAPKVIFNKGYVTVSKEVRDEVVRKSSNLVITNVEASLLYEYLMSNYNMVYLPVRNQPANYTTKSHDQIVSILRESLFNPSYKLSDRYLIAKHNSIRNFIEKLRNAPNYRLFINSIIRNKPTVDVEREYAEIAKRQNCYTPDKLINCLINCSKDDINAQKSMFSVPLTGTNISFNKKINSALCVETIKPPKGFTINIDRKKLQSIMFDYIYVKALRNQINHASDSENLNDEQKKIMHKNGYEVDIINTATIKKQLLKAIGNLEGNVMP